MAVDDLLRRIAVRERVDDPSSILEVPALGQAFDRLTRLVERRLV